jgi:hypothetical protein
MSRRTPLRPRTSSITIDDAINDRALLGAALGGRASWTTWRVVLKSAFGIALDEDEARTFAAVAGNRHPPAQRVRELWAIIGRRGGKSRIAALIAVYLAAFVKHELAHGEVGMVLCLAPSQQQARIVMHYVQAFLEASPVLRQEISSVTRFEVELRNGITIAIHANSFRTVRGRTLVGCVFDECAFWRDESSAAPDVEVYRAVLPSLLTTRGMLVGISTGYRRAGLLYQKHRDGFGNDSSDVLVVQGSTLQFNASLTAADLAAQRQADPAAASSEWDGGFRDDLASFLDDELIDSAIEHGRPLELPPMPYPAFYKAFTDASGGSGHDAYTVAIAHREGNERLCIDCVRGTKTGVKFDPQVVTKEYAELLKEYRISSVTGDAYAAEWTAAAWQKEGISYLRADKPKSQIYIETLPLFARGLVGLPDHPRLLRELRLLERQTHRGGRDTVDHPRGQHDDFANSCCGALHTLSTYLGGFNGNWDWVNRNIDEVTPEDEKARARAEADDWHRMRLRGYLASFGAFGFPPY